MIFAGQTAPPRANPEEIPQAVLNTVLGGQFVSRINMNLREDKHWAYGAHSALVNARGPRPFLVMAPVQSDKTRESVLEILKELRGIRGDKPVTGAELVMAQEAMSLRLPGKWETGGAVAGSIAEIVRFGFDDRYYDGYATRVRSVVLDDLARAARFLEPDRLVWVVVGDRQKIEPGLRSLGLGELHFIDADGNVVR
jgi:zinc protease